MKYQQPSNGFGCEQDGFETELAPGRGPGAADHQAGARLVHHVPLSRFCL